MASLEYDMPGARACGLGRSATEETVVPCRLEAAISEEQTPTQMVVQRMSWPWSRLDSTPVNPRRLSSHHLHLQLQRSSRLFDVRRLPTSPRTTIRGPTTGTSSRGSTFEVANRRAAVLYCAARAQLSERPAWWRGVCRVALARDGRSTRLFDVSLLPTSRRPFAFLRPTFVWQSWLLGMMRPTSAILPRGLVLVHRRLIAGLPGASSRRPSSSRATLSRGGVNKWQSCLRTQCALPVFSHNSHANFKD
ncbi:hypothetical protein HDK90DRAFT_120176 [Phyllosticta capitalensis]|uniref:Uncharacterized protein n=1 Tax=Phyllosticta capitalensis TaxID=121624 RepID=A0ABR1Y8S6_9PEZI